VKWRIEQIVPIGEKSVPISAASVQHMSQYFFKKIPEKQKNDFISATITVREKTNKRYDFSKCSQFFHIR
jgi:hypothetical protein